MNIAVIGQGYVGLTAAVSLADAGHRVTGIDTDAARLCLLQRGELPFLEPGMEEPLRRLWQSGQLDFHHSLSSIPGVINAAIIAVGSPELPSGGADLRQVATAVLDVVALEPAPDLVMVKSTVPPGTSERVLLEAERNISLRERYVYSPEFLSQGSALVGWRNPSRIVVGLHNHGLLPLVREVYRGVEAPWLVTTPTNAEMIKYTSNAFLATRISLINEIANICDEVGANIDEVVKGIALDPRIGGAYLRAGVGYGGSCFPKDTKALAHLSNTKGQSTPLLDAVTGVNNAQRRKVVRIVGQHLDAFLKVNPTVAVLGLSFKPDTDDVREAPSLSVIPELQAQGLRVRVWDPAVSEATIARSFVGVERASTIDEAALGASAIIVLTEWPQVAATSWKALASMMEEPRLVVDGRNCLDPACMKAAGLVYRAIGRGSA